MRHRAAKASRESGFTLVEALVALALLSLLSLLLLGSLRFGVAAWKRNTSHSEWADMTLVLQGQLRHLIGDAYPMYTSKEPTRSHVAFDGSVTSLTFLAPTPIALGSAGRSWLQIFADQQGDRSDLVMAVKPELSEQSSPAAKRTVVANVKSLEFAYFGKARTERLIVWRDTWSEQATLPRLVRMRVTFPAGDARRWPDLVIAPRITADVSCVFDPLTKQCRGR